MVNQNQPTQNQQQLLEENLILSLGQLLLTNIRLDTDLRWKQMELEALQTDAKPSITDVKPKESDTIKESDISNPETEKTNP